MMQKVLADLQRRVAQTPQDASAATPALRTARALIIGNSDYRGFARLANPRNDALGIADKLRDMGIAVKIVLDADRDTFVKALNEPCGR